MFIIIFIICTIAYCVQVHLCTDLMQIVLMPPHLPSSSLVFGTVSSFQGSFLSPETFPEPRLPSYGSTGCTLHNSRWLPLHCVHHIWRIIMTVFQQISQSVLRKAVYANLYKVNIWANGVTIYYSSLSFISFQIQCSSWKVRLGMYAP